MDRFFVGRGRVDRLRAMATVGGWRTITAEQAACVSGAQGLTNPRSTVVRSMFEAGLVDVGTWVSPLRAPTSRDWILRPSSGSQKAFEQLVQPRLTYPEWVSVTGGLGWDAGGQFDRHNILSVELALRVAEFCHVGTVMGEKFGTIDLLAGAGAGRDLVGADNRSADAVMVRPDGLRIAVELTASTSSSFKRKVSRWAQLLATSPLGQTGLVVLFVMADPEASSDTYEKVAQVIRQASLMFPGVVGDRVAERMVLADWRDWFPGLHEFGDGFLGLRGRRPTGVAGDPWEAVDLLGPDQMPFRPWDAEAMLEVLVNAQGLASVPVWLRDPAQGRQMWPVSVSKAGFAQVPELPVIRGGDAVMGQVPDRLLMI